MRTLAIGDIHGCLTALNTLLAHVDPRPDDQLVFLGDYVDRGPHSRGVIDRLIGLIASHNVVALRGNHEVMMMQAREPRTAQYHWMFYGGRETLESYSPKPNRLGRLDEVPDGHWRFLDDHCQNLHELERVFFVHANAWPDVELEDQPTDMLHWEHIDPIGARRHKSGKVMICGHTKQKSGVPLDLVHTICIDTWAYGDGYLTCLDIDTGEYWQASDGGVARRGQLERHAERFKPRQR